VGGSVGGVPLSAPPSRVLSPSVPLVPPVPSPPTPPPRVLPVGDWQVLLATDVPVLVEVAVGLPGGGERPEPASTAAGGGVDVVTQVQSGGQSASMEQVLTFNWQVPGNEVEVVQTGWLAVPASAVAVGGTGGISAPEAPPVPEVDPPLAFPVPAVPPPVAPGLDPEHVPRTVGWQTKPSPQSPSALHGKLHRYAHWLTVELVQVGASTGTGGHTVFGGQSTGAAAPPEQVVTVSLWQTMPWPQSASLVQVWPKLALAWSRRASVARARTKVFVVRMSSPPSRGCAARKQHVLCQSSGHLSSRFSQQYAHSPRQANQNSDDLPTDSRKSVAARFARWCYN